MIPIDFSVKVDAVDRHRDGTDNANDAQCGDYPGCFISPSKCPRCQKDAKQCADGYKDDVESFERHGKGGFY